MKHFIDIYWAYFKTSLALQFQYRAAMAIWMISRILEPVIYLVVWTTVAEARGGRVGSFSPEDFAAYYIILMLVNQFTFTWIMHEFESRIRHGFFSPLLLKPIHPIHGDIVDNVAYKVLTAVIIFPTALLLTTLFNPALHLETGTAILFLPALFLAFTVRFIVEWALALAAFWTTRVQAINQIYFLLSLFLSGRIAPLSLLPRPIQTLADLLPFRWIVAFPVELLLGRLTPAQIQTGFLAQTAWLLLSLGLLTLIWRRGLRRYSAVGS